MCLTRLSFLTYLARFDFFSLTKFQFFVNYFFSLSFEFFAHLSKTSITIPLDLYIVNTFLKYFFKYFLIANFILYIIRRTLNFNELLYHICNLNSIYFYLILFYLILFYSIWFHKYLYIFCIFIFLYLIVLFQSIVFLFNFFVINQRLYKSTYIPTRNIFYNKYTNKEYPHHKVV